MKSSISQIRKKFLKFFKKKKHKILPGSSIIPENDKTLLFTNAGMNQFKNFYLGSQIPTYKRITTTQYCIRTGGKNDDLNKIGYSNFHHTLFEMLGNFSFGNYSKKKAIIYAWTLLTKKKWFNLSKKKIVITYYKHDKKTLDIWLNVIKINKKQIISIDDQEHKKYFSDNFWSMGETGPCGPCTEIFYQLKSYNSKNIYPTVKNLKKYYVEIWNLVFLQFNRSLEGKLFKLPYSAIDTGMGIERIAAILQKVNSSYKIKEYIILIKSIANKLKISLNNKKLLKILSDHIRTTVFLLNEKLYPSNEGQGYVLRRIIRRALSHGYCKKLKTPFFYKLIKYGIKNLNLKNSYLNIHENYLKTKKILKKEEKKFFLILNKSMKILLKEIKISKNSQICGKKIFYLNDTLGLPIEISKDICQKNNITINFQEFTKEQQTQKIKQKKKLKNYKNILIQENFINIKHSTIFSGYTKSETTSKILQIISNNISIKKIKKGMEGILILDETPFFSESGGQIGDSGIIKNNNSIFLVKTTKKYLNFIGHIGIVSVGNFQIQNTILAKIDTKKRFSIQSNHTATHLLQATLQILLNKNIIQKGSYINEKYFRFDFKYTKKIKQKKINEIELLINQKIQKNINITSTITDFKKIKKKKIIALFKNKYKKKVRIINIKNFSKELCGGTHQKNTGNIGLFKILLIKKIGFEIQRIEACTGIQAILEIQKKNIQEIKISKLLNTTPQNLLQNVKNLIKKNVILIKKNNYLNLQYLNNLSKKIIKHQKIIKNISIIIYTLQNKNYNTLKELIQKIQQKKKNNIIILFYPQKNNTNFIIYFKKNTLKNFSAKKIMKKLFTLKSGKGGGNSEFMTGILNTQKNIYIIQNLLKNWIYKKLFKQYE